MHHPDREGRALQPHGKRTVDGSLVLHDDAQTHSPGACTEFDSSEGAPFTHQRKFDATFSILNVSRSIWAPERICASVQFKWPMLAVINSAEER